MTGENPRNWKKSCHHDTLSTTNPTSTGLPPCYYNA